MQIWHILLFWKRFAAGYNDLNWTKCLISWSFRHFSGAADLGASRARLDESRMVRMVGQDSGNLPMSRIQEYANVTCHICKSFLLFQMCRARSSKAHGQVKNCFLTSNLNRDLLTEKEWGRHVLQPYRKGSKFISTCRSCLVLSRLFTPEVWGVGACVGEKTCKKATDLRRKKITLCQWNNGKQQFSTQSKDV